MARKQDKLQDTLTARSAAQAYVQANLHELCHELVSLDDTGLFGTGKLHELRLMCAFSGASAQALCIGMVNQAALRQVATAPVAPSARRIGGSILPSSEPRILKPCDGLHGTFQVRPLPELDTHGLYLGKRLLVTHPNGYSCFGLAERIMQVWRGEREVSYALEQFDYILACGGLGTQRKAIAAIAAIASQVDVSPGVPAASAAPTPRHQGAKNLAS